MRIFLLFLFFLSPFASLSQDKIYRVDGSSFPAYVTDTTAYTIKYKKPDHPDGPKREIHKGDVLMVVFENGDHMNVSVNEDREEKEKVGSDSMFTKHYYENLLGSNLLDLLLQKVTISYERILGDDGGIGLKANFSYGFKSSPTVIYHERFRLGLESHFYFGGQGRARYYLGPGIHYGSLINEDCSVVGGLRQCDRSMNEYLGGHFVNGLLIQPTRSFNLNFELAIGLRHVYASDQLLLPSFSPRVNLIYRF